MKPSARTIALDSSGTCRNESGRAPVPVSTLAPKGVVRTHTKLLALLAISLVALFASTASANAASSATTPEASNVSYSSADVTGTISSPCEGFFGGGLDYSFQYSTDEVTWKSGSSESTFCPGSFNDKKVEGKIQGLNGGTKYFIRLTVTNNGIDAVSPGPNPSFTTLAVDPPTIHGAVEASPVFSTSAKAIGKVKRPANEDPAFDVNCHFEYITDALYEENVTNIGAGAGFTGATPAPCEQNPVDKADLDAEPETKVTAPLTGLNPVTAYHLRMIAENAAPGAVIKEAAGTFTTEPTVAKPTVIAANDATDPSYFSAKASGEIQRPTGADPALNTSCRFEYVTDQQFNDNPPGDEFAGAGQTECVEAPSYAPLTTTDPTVVTAELSGLKSGTTFHLRLTAANEGGATNKDAASTFTTLAATPPAIAIDPPSNLGYTKVHLSGSVDPEGGTIDPTTSEPFPIFWQLQFSRADQPDSWQFAEAGTIAGAEATTTDPIAVGVDLGGLEVGTQYQYRLQASYADREALSSEGSFTTTAVAKPEISLDPVTIFTDTTAKFTGSVSANAPGPLDSEGEDLYRTQWSISCEDPDCPTLSGQSAGTVEAAAGVKAFSIDATDLEPNLPYTVTLKAVNAAGTQTVVQTFHTTATAPTVKLAAGASDREGGYTLQGVVSPNNSLVTDCEFVYGPTSELDPKKYPFAVPCSPTPRVPDEVQELIFREGKTEGHYSFTFRGQKTGEIPFDAPASVVQAEMRALSAIGPDGVTVTEFIAGFSTGYELAFGGPLKESNLPPVVFNEETLTCAGCGPGHGHADVLTHVEGGNTPVTVEGHVTALTPGATYHFRLVVTNGVGTKVTDDQTFSPTLDPGGPACPNEQQRIESNSLALPECRAYEMVTSPNKEGFGASFNIADQSGTYEDGGDRVAYISGAGNIAKSGQGGIFNSYLASRTESGWQTIPNLNGSSGSLRDAPTYVDSNINKTALRAYSPDLLSSIWWLHRKGDPGEREGINSYLRSPDGTFLRIGTTQLSSYTLSASVRASADLSHLLTWTEAEAPGEWGLGVYEYVGTGMDQPRRVDLDNSDTPISTCTKAGTFSQGVALNQSISADGSRIVNSIFGGCGGANPPANEIWARIDGTTAIDVSASQCNRVAPAPACNAPANANFAAATPDGSRVLFTTTQQLVDEDVDQTNDIYACDLPAGNPAPTVEKANHCAALIQISGAQTGAAVENVDASSEDGTTVLFTAKGKLADDDDAFGEQAAPGDHNLYLWRADGSHPDGQTSFVARLDSSDLIGFAGGRPQVTPDGRSVVFTTAAQLLDTDTDTARDVYRYEAETGDLTRVSTNIFGVAGNGDSDAQISGPREHQPTTAISDDGTRIVFTTTEPLKLAVDNNDAPDVYLWTPDRVSLVSTGAVGAGGAGPMITASGNDIYFTTPGALTPPDPDSDIDIYDARIGGGFSFAPEPVCTGEECQPPPATPPVVSPAPANRPKKNENVVPKTCPKGKVRNKKGKCVKKTKKHSVKGHHGKKAGHKQGGGK